MCLYINNEIQHVHQVSELVFQSRKYLIIRRESNQKLTNLGRSMHCNTVQMKPTPTIMKISRTYDQPTQCQPATEIIGSIQSSQLHDILNFQSHDMFSAVKTAPTNID